jgi:hypothetical protein
MKTLKIFILLPLAAVLLLAIFLYIFYTFGDQILAMLEYIFNSIFGFINSFMALIQLIH